MPNFKLPKLPNFKLPKLLNLNKEQKRKIILLFAPRLAWFAMWFIYLTSRNRFAIDEKITAQNAIFIAWHGELLMLPFLYRKIRQKSNIFILASEHFDAELIVRICALFGMQNIRGSSTKGGRRAIIQSIARLKEGKDIAIMPDGPRGPYHSIADGAPAIAQKTGSPLIVLQVRARRFWELDSWDRFRIPKPFGRIDYYASAPFCVDCALGIDSAKEIIYQKMTGGLNEGD
ncbi:lysophospholipid acyltransferase family protein [Helicobacter sp. 23-1044]